MGEWFEDESFWRDTYAFMFPEERYEAAPEDVDGILELTGVREGRVLDLCSGPGRHAVELAKRGFTVTGVDRTPFLMEKARARAVEAGVEVEWVESDMRDFVRPGAFDLALNLFTSFGYFDDKSEDLKVLANLYESLRPGGILVMEMMGKERLAKIFLRSSADRLADGKMLVERREVIDEWTRCRNEWTLIDGQTVRTMRFHHTVYSAQELRDRLEATGFTEVRMYGSFQGEEYGLDAKRLTAVARRPGDEAGGP
jgi:SAM-dependent methyltransferase